VLASACDELAATGDPEAAAEAEAALAELNWDRGDADRSAEHLGRACQLVQGRKPSRAKTFVTSRVSFSLTLAGEYPDAIRLGREALAMAEALGLDQLRALALHVLGLARVGSGDPAGIQDIEKSIAVARQANAPSEICRELGDLAAVIGGEQGQLERAYAISEEGAEVASRFGLVGRHRWFRGLRPYYQYEFGLWDAAVAGLDEFLAEVEAGSPHYLASNCYEIRAKIRLGRDDVVGALADAEHAIELARLTRDPQNVYPTVVTGAHIFCESGDTERASRLADESLAALRAGSGVGPSLDSVHVLAWTLSALGRGQELIEALPTVDVPWVRAAAAFAAGDLSRAADICAGMGATTEKARDRLGLAEKLITHGRRAEADVELERALAFYRSVGAKRYVRQAERMENCQVGD
jgi:ATP/maltotriose-dependent transcriptional regulator MalT